MSVTFNNVQELEEYFRYLEETIHDDERRLVLRGIAIARNLYIFSEYRKRQARLRAACIRTLLSGRTAEVPSENEFIEKFGLVPGPHYTDEFLAKGMLSPARTVKTHKNFRPEEIGLPLLAKLLAEKYYIMAECMYNYAHWVVVLGYFAVRDPEDTEEHRILLYDPYYDQVRLVIADEFLTMWCDPDGHVKEFVAIR